MADQSDFKLIQTRRTFEEVVAQVRTMLFDGSLKPGDRLPPERELAQVLGVGRPALREALRVLEAKGLVVLRKGKTGGAFVSSGRASLVSDSMSDLLRLGSVSADELFEARQWIQSGFVRAACARATAADLKLLRDNVAEGERLHKAGLAAERIAVNIEFHHLLAQATHNQVAVMVARGLTDALRNLIREVGSDPAPSLFRDRWALVTALEARDEEAAVKAMIKILKTTMVTYQRLAEVRRAKEEAPSAPRRVRARPA